MSPGGHAATTVVASTAAALYSGSLPVAAGVAAGGFLIDLDHAVDYVLFNGQTDVRPSAFLRYYLEGRPHRVVLMLHSYELFALLIAVGCLLPSGCARRMQTNPAGRSERSRCEADGPLGAAC